MSKKMKEEGPMDKKHFYDRTALTGKVKPRSEFESQLRAIVWWCLDIPGQEHCEKDLLNADSHKAVIAVTHRGPRVGMAKV